MCDIEGMFHQFKVSEAFRDLLRFLWWGNGDISSQPSEYRMTVHLFGATSSPGRSNFALKSTANDNEREIDSTAANFLRVDSFYVDDGVKSVPSVDEAVQLIKDAKEMVFSGASKTTVSLFQFQLLSQPRPGDSRQNFPEAMVVR